MSCGRFINRKFFSRFVLAALFLGVVSGGLFARDIPVRHIVDDSSLRISIRDTWFTEIPARVLNKSSFIHNLPGGGRIQVRTERGKDEFGIVLAREQNGVFSGFAQGSWGLVRSREDGSLSKIRIFLRSDQNTYIQFRPFNEDKTVMDVVVYNAYLVHSLPMPLTMERLLVMPLGELLTVAGGKFPLRYFDPRPEMYRDTRAFIGNVRKRLSELNFRDDGALHENNNYVFINTLEAQSSEPGLNCSGFAKWVVDGLLRPFTGERLEITPLKQPYGERRKKRLRLMPCSVRPRT
ncbi:hypothetical protein AGMMS49928_28780 [Spirochaetia bacterium]|nr:hypothetical protein AGMMS49928_28780 [Spirochaetia bacterium]